MGERAKIVARSVLEVIRFHSKMNRDLQSLFPILNSQCEGNCSSVPMYIA